MSIPTLPTLSEILALDDAGISALEAELRPIVTLVHRLKRADADDEPHTPPSGDDEVGSERFEGVDLQVERVNPSGRVIFNVPGRGPAAHQVTKSTRRKLRGVKPGDVVHARVAEYVIRPHSREKVAIKGLVL